MPRSNRARRSRRSSPKRRRSKSAGSRGRYRGKVTVTVPFCSVDLTKVNEDKGDNGYKEVLHKLSETLIKYADEVELAELLKKATSPNDVIISLLRELIGDDDCDMSLIVDAARDVLFYALKIKLFIQFGKTDISNFTDVVEVVATDGTINVKLKSTTTDVIGLIETIHLKLTEGLPEILTAELPFRDGEGEATISVYSTGMIVALHEISRLVKEVLGK